MHVGSRVAFSQESLLHLGGATRDRAKQYRGTIEEILEERMDKDVKVNWDANTTSWISKKHLVEVVD